MAAQELPFIARAGQHHQQNAAFVQEIGRIEARRDELYAQVRAIMAELAVLEAASNVAHQGLVGVMGGQFGLAREMNLPPLDHALRLRQDLARGQEVLRLFVERARPQDAPANGAGGGGGGGGVIRVSGGGGRAQDVVMPAVEGKSILIS